MIGIVITGHGKWASGMLNAITLLAGKPEHVIAIDFLQEDSSDDLSDKLKQALKNLEDCQSIAIFTDVLDATPYREALEVRQDYIGEREIEVITGTMYRHSVIYVWKKGKDIFPVQRKRRRVNADNSSSICFICCNGCCDWNTHLKITINCLYDNRSSYR